MRRVGAMLYDAFLVAALWMAVAAIFVAFRRDAVPLGDAGLRIALSVITFGFYVGFWAYKGRTLGMQSWGLQLERLDGSKPDLGQLTVRFFAAILSWLPAGLGFLWQLVDRDDMAWHDRLSKTRLKHYPREKK